MPISDTFFLYPSDEGLILWNFELHEQYVLDGPATRVIEHLARTGQFPVDTPPEVRSTLYDGGLVNVPSSNRWKWDVLSRIFHQGTKDVPISEDPSASPSEWVEEYLKYCQEIGSAPTASVPGGSEIICLPAPDLSFLDKTSIRQALAQRKTSRVFTGAAVDVQTLGDLLFTTFGPFHGEWSEEFDAAGLEVTAGRKTSPSGGGLHPVRAYVVVVNVDGVTAGNYFYDEKQHGLREITPSGPTGDLSELLWGQYYSTGISFGVFLAARFDLALEQA